MPGFSNDEQRAAVAARARPPPLAQQGGQAHRRARRGLEHGVRAAARRALLPQPGRRGAARHAGEAARARSSGSRWIPAWLARNPLTATALHEEVREWDKIGFELKVPGLEELEAGTELRSRRDAETAHTQVAGARSRGAHGHVAVAAREPPDRAFLQAPALVLPGQRERRRLTQRRLVADDDDGAVAAPASRPLSAHPAGSRPCRASSTILSFFVSACAVWRRAAGRAREHRHSPSAAAPSASPRRASPASRPWASACARRRGMPSSASACRQRIRSMA